LQLRGPRNRCYSEIAWELLDPSDGVLSETHLAERVRVTWQRIWRDQPRCMDRVGDRNAESPHQTSNSLDSGTGYMVISTSLGLMSGFSLRQGQPEGTRLLSEKSIIP
jgi:hypothetical protein